MGDAMVKEYSAEERERAANDVIQYGLTNGLNLNHAAVDIQCELNRAVAWLRTLQIARKDYMAGGSTDSFAIAAGLVAINSEDFLSHYPETK